MTDKEREELVYYRFSKAKEAISDALELTGRKKWNLAINRLYYGCFYGVIALLADREIYTKTHMGAKQMLSLHFVKSGEFSKELSDLYSKLFSMRQSGDYEDFCEYEEEDVLELIAPANEFIKAIEQILYNI